MPPIDPEMAEAVHAHLAAKGVKLALADGVSSFEQVGGRPRPLGKRHPFQGRGRTP